MAKTAHQFSKFVVAGGIAACANFYARYRLGFHMPYVPSIILAYCVGMITAYLFCRLFVFEPRRHSTLQQISYFTAINVLAILQTIIVSLIFADFVFKGIHDLSLRESLAHFIGICVPVFTSYFGHKHLTFK